MSVDLSICVILHTPHVLISFVFLFDSLASRNMIKLMYEQIIENNFDKHTQL